MTPYREQGITALFTISTAAAANNNNNRVPHSADSACVKGHLLTLYPFCLSVHAASGEGGTEGIVEMCLDPARHECTLYSCSGQYYSVLPYHASKED